MSCNWSNYQNDIFAFIANETGNAVVEAVAGSGKSTTIVEGIRHVPAGLSTIFLAFNKAIAEELKSKGVNARTFHSLTYTPVMRHVGANSADGNKLRRLVEQNLNGREARLYGKFITQLTSLGKQAGIGCLLPDVEGTWLDIVTHHDMELEEVDADLGRALTLASELLEWSNKSTMVDFDDMLYLPVLEGISLPKFDVVFVDEAQDTNAIQRALLRKILKPGGRMIAVGDPAQAIYGFRGAGSESLNIIANEFDCKRLPLTVSYRCPTSVVEYARQWVDHIEAAPGAPAGEVINLDKWGSDTFQPNDLIVCRTTRPLIGVAYKLLKDRVPARILGREVGEGLVTLIRKMKATNLDELVEKMGRWEEREVEKALGKGNDAKVDAIHDKVDCIRFLCDSLSEDEQTVTALLDVIDQLFNPPGTNVVTLCTGHKAKGLEANRVFWLNRSACPSKWARQGWQIQQELNICYVIATRAKQSLFLIEEKQVAAV